jgi:hypothetical protein
MEETLMPFEDRPGGAFAVGLLTEVVGMQNPDGIVIAIEIQVAPYDAIW